MKYIIECSPTKKNINEGKLKFSRKPIEDKDSILEWLKNNSKQFSAITTAKVIDWFTEEEIDVYNHLSSDGEYQWAQSHLYYFEKYNLVLKSDFLDYVRNKIRCQTESI